MPHPHPIQKKNPACAVVVNKTTVFDHTVNLTHTHVPLLRTMPPIADHMDRRGMGQERVASTHCGSGTTGPTSLETEEKPIISLQL